MITINIILPAFESTYVETSRNVLAYLLSNVIALLFKPCFIALVFVQGMIIMLVIAGSLLRCKKKDVIKNKKK